MKGNDLIKWIVENHAEEMDVVTYNDPYIGDLRDIQPEIKEESDKKLVTI